MLSALQVTGGVITSAGVLLAAVFAVLGVLPLIVLTQIGIIVGVGVLLDTLLVRTVLVPALAFIAGDTFWWPAKIANNTIDIPLPGHRSHPEVTRTTTTPIRLTQTATAIPAGVAVELWKSIIPTGSSEKWT